MKMFDWMHRKLHHTAAYRRVSHRSPQVFEEEGGEMSKAAQRLPATASPENELETEAPLLHHVLEGMILTIGTFGHPNILLLPHHLDQVPELDQPDVTAMPAVILPPPVSELFKPIPCIDDAVVAIPSEEASHEEETMAKPLLKEDRERKQRTTLADLFAAEPTVPPAGNSPASVTPAKIASPVKASLLPSLKRGSQWKTKKKMKETGHEEGSPPSSTIAAKNLNKVSSSSSSSPMIRRMLKKRIHPEAAAPVKKGSAVSLEVAAPLLLVGGRDGSHSMA
ncbi:hypothetical protein AXF42_Ash020899 [Apostasia shenzhenica]|uniref:Protein TILLER ANGLE CONTROL 1 n=1 Tax=Apostasia shenzhenica TaxID=1088818 RepID=A0A2I0AD86_9ASPA|nr:hypothetical protein AXF42_Ash020899 [Apostasia shenzhenica]